MIGVPPLLFPGYHVKLMIVALVTVALLNKLIGASGKSQITAPLPATE
jgi:hypothetical protein